MPVEISNAVELQAMNDDLTGAYVVVNDIDLAATSGWNAGAGFVPIGNNANRFTGAFDGGGFTLSDLFINRPSTDYVGLFGVLAPAVDDTIKSFHLSGTITGKYYVGGITGYIRGKSHADISSDCVISAQHIAGSFAGLIANAATISRCYALGSVTGTLYGHGGFAGQTSAATINRCYANASVSSPYSVGGFVGYTTGTTTMNDCYARGNVTGNTTNDHVGGFVGRMIVSTDQANRCYSTGTVVNNGSGSEGGFCGEKHADATITDCFWDTESSGVATSDGGTGKTTAQMKTEATFTNWDFDTIWRMDSRIEDGYPALRDIGYTITFGIDDAFVLADAVGKGVSLELADPMGMADALAKGAAKVFADTVGISDALNREIEKAFSDAMGMVDALSILHAIFPGTIKHIAGTIVKKHITGTIEKKKIDGELRK